MPRDGARTAPLPSADLQFCVRGFLRCQKRQLGFSLKERSKDQRNAGPMPRDGARTAPSLRAVLRFCVRVFLRCRKRQLGFSLKERSKDQRDAGPMPRDGARTAPSLRAVLRFCVRGFLRCRKRQLGFSLKERSKDQRDAGPMPRGRGAGRPLPGAKPLARTYSPLSIRRERQFTAPGRELSRPVPARSRKIFPTARKYTTMVTAGPRMSDRGSA